MSDETEATPGRDRWPRLPSLLLVLFLAMVVVWATVAISSQRGIETLRDKGVQRLSIYASSIRGTVGRYEHLPYALMQDEDVRTLFDNTRSELLRNRVNSYLEELNDRAGSAVLYVLNTDGRTLAASNWREPGSFVGNDYSFRPYFREAVANGRGAYYGIGVTTGVPGYFLAEAAIHEGRTLGIGVVKIDFQPLENDWRKGGEQVTLADAQGIIFLSSRPDWKYRSLRPLAADVLARLAETRQYDQVELVPLDIVYETSEATDGTIFSVRGTDERILMQTLDLPEFGWTLRYLTDLGAVTQQAWVNAGIALMTLAIATVGILLGQQRRQTLRVERAARETLEQRVKERTRELVTINRQLEGEIQERQRTEQELRSTQDELVQAGKLAALGRMSAAIAHELSQPLAAIQMFIAGTRTFAERGDARQVAENLDMIKGLAERMARISEQLKTFARKRAARREKVHVAGTVGQALQLLEPRLREEGVKVIRRIDPEACTLGDTLRLEQVLLNLFQNALDAMSDSPRRYLEIALARENETWSLRVSDTGSGIPETHIHQIFDPFFTTKEVGKGLGLGLSLSYSIVQELGGTIRAENNTEGGATFTVKLPCRQAPAPREVHHG